LNQRRRILTLDRAIDLTELTRSQDARGNKQGALAAFVQKATFHFACSSLYAANLLVERWRRA